MTGAHGRPDYGLDAPGVVRNLFLAGAAGLILAGLVWAGALPASVSWQPGPGLDIRLGLLGLGLGPGLGCTVVAGAMLWTSRIGKVRGRERLLDALEWSGDEKVLDVGCGLGLLLIGAAKRLRSGCAIGVDLWRSEDLSGNRPDATLANARAEGVAERVRVETADMRHLPFADHSFERVLSSAAIHNLAQAQDRAQAIREIARVLRPGGYALIDDIRHIGEYRNVFLEAGIQPVRRLDSPILGLLWTILTAGSLRPGTLLVRRPA